MKTTGTRSLILVLLTLAFVAGMALFLSEYVTDGGSWAIQPFNKHITQGQSLSGRVLDRNGTLLAYSDETGRIYHDDQTIRLAMLHSVAIFLPPPNICTVRSSPVTISSPALFLRLAR